MSRIETATDLNLSPVPIVRLDFLNGGRVTADPAQAASLQIPASRAYLLTPSVDVFVSISMSVAPAGDAAGSMFLAAGSQYHTLAKAGETLSVIAAVDKSGALFIVPLAGSYDEPEQPAGGGAPIL